jgi:hypothetical protein
MNSQRWLRPDREEVLDAIEAVVERDRVEYLAYESRLSNTEPVKVVRAPNSPSTGITTYCTFGLHRRLWDGGHLRVRYEVLTGCRQAFDLGQLLAAVFDVLQWKDVQPVDGRYFSDIVSNAGLHELATRFPHAVLLPPFPWAKQTEKLDLIDAELRLAYVMPISTPERDALALGGRTAFEDLMELNKRDVFDLRLAH